MKHITTIALIFLFACTNAQADKFILRQKLIDDLSETPIYPILTQEVAGRIEWKENFRYLDSIEIYAITYLSDGLKVNGLLVKPKKKGNYPCIIYTHRIMVSPD